MQHNRRRVVIVGSGPNGLVAAVRLARAGAEVTVLEAAPEPGGGLRSGELVAAGTIHDHCASVHPLGAISPAFRALGIEQAGVAWRLPGVQLAHPFDDGTAVALRHDLDATVDGLGVDGPAWRQAVKPVTDAWAEAPELLLGPPLRMIRRPGLASSLLPWLAPADRSARRFPSPRGRALWAGLAAHTAAPLSGIASSIAAHTLGSLAHLGGWPVAGGGSGAIAAALVRRLEDAGGRLEVDRRVEQPLDLPAHDAAILSTSVATLLRLFPDASRGRWGRAARAIRPGPGVVKVDYLLSEPIPWTAPDCRAAGTVHLGGGFPEIAAALRDVHRGTPAHRPFVLVGQPTVADPDRAPEGRHTAWAYCHVPAGDAGSGAAERIERQIERFAPGFGRAVLDRLVSLPADLEGANPTLAGGDIGGGSNTGLALVRRPVWSPTPYRTPVPGVYLASASTSPGGGAHGMAGWHAAGTLLDEWNSHGHPGVS